MSVTLKPQRTDRHPGESYGDFLDRDTHPVPENLREGPVPDIGTDPVDVARYITPDFARREEKHLWSRIWQMVCREEEIAKPGDTLPYDIAGRSLLVTRQSDGSVRAFHNSCLHRGRKLATTFGCKKEFRCPYHGIAWNTDGTFKDNPIGWDFPQWEGSPMNLPEVRIATWGGFVFANFDPDAPAFEDVAAPLIAHFDRYRLQDCYVAIHIQKLISCNWKVATEAFMESHHAATTHPQILPHIADVNSQYDALSDHVTRQFSAQMVPSPFAGREYSQEEIVHAVLGFGSRRRSSEEDQDELELNGMSARAYIADLSRRMYAQGDGYDYSDKSDAEMVDALLYNLFPNLSIWAGFMPNLVYRWRPNGVDHQTSIMDIYVLKRVPRGGARPTPALAFEIGLQDSFLEMGPKAGMSPALAAVFEQDMLNLPHVQTGLMASAEGVVHFSHYSEMRIRLMHLMIDRYLAEGEALQ